MHACGHDGHTAVGLAVAELLSKHRAQMVGRIKFVFQPAEEIGQGARAMVDDGVLENPTPDVALGLHFWSGLETGKVAASSGPVMAGADIFHITITGRGGHGALPQQTKDPIAAAAQIITALNSVVSRSVSALDAAVLSVCSVSAGDAFNVIPSEAKLSGTFRTFKPEVRDLLIERSRAIAEGIANAMGCEATLSVQQTTSAVYNDPAVTETVRQAAGQHLVSDPAADVRTMGAEDMCEFLSRVPGCFFFVGSGNPDKGTDYAHHHPRFDLDEDALAVAAGLMATAAARYVLKNSE
jgi:amidohydrolase